MISSVKYDGKVFNVRQETEDGKQKWNGEVIVWKHQSESHGRKNKGFEDGDWKQGDKLTLFSCAQKGRKH